VLFAAVIVATLAGCSALQSAPPSQPSGTFSISVSSQGTFLLNTQTGKVWLYDPSTKAFLEIPATSNIITVTPEDLKNTK
jgi:hypothetical protein